VDGDLIQLEATVQGGSIHLIWTNGSPPFTVQRKSTLSDATWSDVGTTQDRSFDVPLEGATGFFRVADQP
jgi:hypothetical protein